MDEDEGSMERARVRCLSDVVGLQRACQSASLRFSAETNKFLVYDTLQKLGLSAAQKLVSKLVDDGFIKWEDDEEYEVEDILDHADEDGKRYYLIKWIGWSQFHNSWEPAENLECPGVISDYLASIEKSKTHLSIKRSLPKMSESAQISKRRKVDEIFHKLWCSPMSDDMTPLQLLTMHRNQVKPNAKQVVHKGLVSSHDRTMRPKFSTTAPDYSNKKKKVYKQKKAEIQLALKDWEKRLNTVNSDPAPIAVQNDIDLEGPPENFVYINDYRAGEGIEIPQDPIIGCECECCFDEKKTCCGAACGSEFAYYRGKRLRVPRGTPIYECNKRCKCGPECPNRVVQEGRKFKVCIFRTSNSRGWGIKTLQKIKRGSFVMEYVGEVITNEEAERRGKVYDAECRTYLFDLDYNDGDCPFTVDAGYYGNVSHFVNHSCEPNLVVYGVWINTLDPRLPRICLFADRDIEKGEELTFDYMMTGDTTQPQQNLGFAAQLSPGRELTDTGIRTLSSADSEGTLSQGTSQTDLSESPEIPSSSETYDTPPSSPSKGRWDASSSPSKGQEHIPSSPSKNLRASQVSPSKGHKTVPDSPSKGHKTALSKETEMVLKSPLKESETAPTSSSKGQKTIPASPSKRDKIVPASPLKGDTSVPTSPSKGDKKGSSSPSKTQKEPPSFSPEKLQSPPVLPPKFSLPSPDEDMSSDKSLPVSAKSPGAVSSDEKKTPGQAKKKYRMICQCGSAKCRKYLF